MKFGPAARPRETSILQAAAERASPVRPLLEWARKPLNLACSGELYAAGNNIEAVSKLEGRLFRKQP